MVKIDIYSHVMLPRYKQELYKYTGKLAAEKAGQGKKAVFRGGKARPAKLETYGDIVQVLSATMPPVEEVAGPKEAAELARICNDEMAEMVASRPDRYITAIANIPLNDPEMAVKEAERAIKQLGFRGIQIYTMANGRPPSTESMMPLYQLMVDLDLPIWLHPVRGPGQPDRAAEDKSFNQLFSIYGWPYDTTAAMVRLVFAGLFEWFPTIKIITHHLGGLVPYFSDRAALHWDSGLQRLGGQHFPGLKRHPVEYMKMFYADTALSGNSNYAMECGLAFFGEDHLLFGTDMPYGLENGDAPIRETIAGIERMALLNSTRQKIYEGNARRLLHL